MTTLDFDPAYVTWGLTDTDLRHLGAAIVDADEVVIDLETTGLAEYAWSGGPQNGGYPARIVLVSLTLPTAGVAMPTTWVVPLSHPDSVWLGRWREVITRIAGWLKAAGRPILNQNLKFDFRWLYAHTGVDLSHLLIWDTLVSSHLLDENASTKLKERAPATFDVSRWDDFDLSTPGAAERVPIVDLGLYAARDTFWTWRLASAHRERMFLSGEGDQPASDDEVEDARLGRLAVWCAMPTMSTLTAIEQRGMVLDRDWVVDQLGQHQTEAEVLSAKLANRYRFDEHEASFAPTSLWFRDWTTKAIEDGQLTVAEMTPNGNPRWSKGVLIRQARLGSEVAADLLELRNHTKKSEFLTSWLVHVDPTGVIHSTYNYGRVVTGRLSSSDPNMQQVTSSLKPAFVPRPGHVFIDLDYSQVELRVAAFISRCEPMLEALRRGDDLHRLLAARITGKDPADVLPSERHGGKSANFGLLYAMSAAGFQTYAETVYGVVFTEEEAIAVRAAFFDTWVGIADWHAQSIARAHRTGQVTSPIGRVRRLPDIWDGNDYLSSAAERQAINSPVQGFASDLMQMAAASIEGRLPGVDPVPGAAIVATVHDDIVVEAPTEDWKRIALDCQDRMTTIGRHLRRLDCDLDVPLTVGVTVGTRWGLDDVGALG